MNSSSPDPPGSLGAAFPYDVASRAANLAEQVRIFEAGRPQDPCAPAGPSLTSLDTWRLQRLARKLSEPRARGRSAPAAERSYEDLEAILTTNRLLQLRSSHLTPDERGILDDVHASWLPTYVAALEAFDPSPAGPTDAGRPDAATQRSRLALACAPFRSHLSRELDTAMGQANRDAGRELIGPGIVRAFGEHLIDRFELPIAWAVEADHNVALARPGMATDREGRPPDHDSYFEQTFHHAASYHRFWLRFPVLARWLATVTALLCDYGRSLMERLSRDAKEIGSELFHQVIVSFVSLSLGQGDYHAGGRSVAIVDAVMPSGTCAFVYKPRCLRSEAAMQGLLERLAGDGVIDFARHRVMARDGYGYEARIPSDRNEVASAEEASRVYQELGGFLGIFHVLGGSDLHYENVIVADGHAFVCDCETVLGVVPPGQEPATGTVIDSVYRTGLLEWPLSAASDVVLRLSACAGGQSYELPFAVPRLQGGPDLAVRHETGIRVDQVAANRVYLNSELLQAQDFEDSIVRGFCRVHDWFRGAGAARCVSELFGDTTVRFVARSTQIYSQLLIGSRHPRCLMEPLEADLVFDRLGEAPHRWDTSGLAALSEARSLWQLDVPTFSAPADGTRVRHDHCEPIEVELERSPLRLSLDRIAGLSIDDQLRQVGYISASLSVTEVHSSSFVVTALEYAGLVGSELRRLLGGTSQPIGWSYRAPGSDSDPVQGSLYYGSAGVALFLAYLDSLNPDETSRMAAEYAAAHALSCAPDGIGAFQGLAGQIYLLTHLHRLWGGANWLAMAIDRARRLAGLIDGDRAFDVLTGCAGVIPVMIGLAEVSGEGLEQAHRCARHLLSHAEHTELGLSWPPERRDEAAANLTGFAHGVAGIGWALIALGVRSSRDEYVEAGKQAFAYEAVHFDQERQDWYDLRTSVLEITQGRQHFGNAWCNGAAGIGLSRLGSWVALGRTDEDLLHQAYLALSATLRGFASLGNDTLCHGRSGNAELYLRFARLNDEPAFQLEANTQAQAHWRRLASTPTWPLAEEGRRTLPGLMVGIAGVGMHFLRLAHPDRVPSVLLLDPPPQSSP